MASGEHHDKTKSWQNKLVQIGSVIAITLGLMALAGWVMGLPQLASFGSGFIPMAPSTALLFVAFGGALFLMARLPQSRLVHRFCLIVGLASLPVTGSLFVLSLWNIHPGIEHLGLRIAGDVEGAALGHMSPLTAFCFILAGISLLALLSSSENRPWRQAVAFSLAGLTVLTSFVLILAYPFGAPILAGGKYIPPALPTSLALLSLGTALLAASLRQRKALEGKAEARKNHAPQVLVLVLLILSFGIVTTGALYYKGHARKYRAEVERQLLAVAQLKTDGLAQWRKERLSDATFFHDNLLFAAEVKHLFENPGDAVSRKRVHQSLQRIQANHQYAQLMLLDERGNLRMSLPDSSSPVPEYLAREFSRIMQSRQVTFLDFHRHGPDQRIHLTIAAPIIDEDAGSKPIGMLAFRIDPAVYLYPLIQSWPTPSDSAETLLVRRDGNDALFLNELRFKKNTALNLRIPLSQEQVPAVKGAMGREGIVEGRDYRGVFVLAAVHAVPESPWSLIAKLDQSDVYTPLRAQLWLVLLLMGVLLGAAATGVGMVWRHQRALHFLGLYEAAVALSRSKERYRITLLSVGDGVIVTDARGQVELLNPVAETLTQWSQDDAQGKPLDDVFRIVNEDTRQPVENPVSRVIREGVVVGLANHTVLIARDGRERPIADSGAPIRDEKGDLTGVVLVFRDQTEERRQFREREGALALTRLLGEPTKTREMIRNVTAFLQKWSGFEAIGVRLKDGDEFPYFETRGFSSKFVESERYLCTHNANGQVVLDEQGQPMLDCMCGNIICGRFDRAKSFFTAKGSFWSNSTTELLATTTDADHQTRTRNRCNGEGYESVGLFRLNVAGETVGLLQLNDRTKDCFTPELIAFMENAADQIGLALSERQAQARLKESEKKFKRLFEESPSGIALIDTQEVLLEVNGSLLNLLEVKREDLVGKSLTDLSADFGLDSQVLLGDFRKRLSGETPTDEWTFIKRSGREATVSIQSSFIVSHGKLTGILFMVNDITERRRSEEALRFAARKWENTFNAISDVIMILSPDHKILEINDAGCASFGRNKEEIVGRKCFEIAHCSSSPMAACPCARVMVSSKPEVSEYEQNGRKYELLAWPNRDKQGRIESLIHIVRDITERKRAEAERARLASAIEQSAEIVIIADSEGTMQYVNPAFEAVTGYSRAEAVGHTPRLLKSGQHDEAFYHGLWGTITGGKTWKGRLINKKKNSAIYTEEATISPVRDGSGNIVNYVAVKHDISDHLRLYEEKSKLEEQLLQAQKMEAIGQLAGGVAHDFNNMLSAILGYTDIVLGSMTAQDPLREDLEQVRLAANRATNLTRQLLAFARKQAVAPVVVDLNEIVASMLKMLHRLIGEEIDLSWMPGLDLWNVKIDPSQVDQILANLAVNARDAIAGVGKLTIETANVVFDQAYCADHEGFAQGEYVMLAVSDTGVGMSKEVLEHLFEPFFTTKEVGKGTGLGLATVYGIVKQNDGFINVYSEPGQGTTFRLYLHRFAAETAAATAQMEEKPKRGTETVLLVEDEAAILILGKRILEQLGYTVLTSSKPGEAIQLVGNYSGTIDLLITDVVMPEMNGRELAEKLLASRPGLKYIFMSGYTADLITHRGVLDEGVNFIQKPFSMKVLADKVRAALDKD